MVALNIHIKYIYILYFNIHGHFKYMYVYVQLSNTTQLSLDCSLFCCCYWFKFCGDSYTTSRLL